MQQNTSIIAGAASLVVGLLVFLVSVTGIFWPATPVTDPGMLWTSVVFVLLGVFGILLGRQQATL